MRTATTHTAACVAAGLLLPSPWPGERLSAQAMSPSPAGPTAHILLLWDTPIQAPFVQLARQGLEQALLRESRRPVSFYDESLDLDRFPTPEQQQRLRAVLRLKYEETPFDVIIAAGRYPLEVARELRGTLRSRPGRDSIPILYSFDEPGRPADSASLPRGPAMAGLVMGSSETETGRRMRALIPGLREVVAVVGLPEQEAFLANELRAGLGAGVRITMLVGPSPGRLQGALARLQRPAAMYYFRVFRDEDGTAWLPRDYLQRVAADAPVPIFSALPAYLGSGSVGGALRDPARHGAEVAHLAAALLNGTPIERIPTRLADFPEDRYDWGLLKRFGLDPDVLPAGTAFVGKPVPIWTQYPRVSAIVSVLLLTLATAVAMLARSRRRLGQVSEDRGHLAQHLLTLQESERQRIARDLHDDVCQEMSAIAVELDHRDSLERARRRDDPDDRGARRPRPPIADRLRVLVERTRKVAHGLHAEPLSYAHLGHVLQQEAAVLLERHHICCTVTFADAPLRLSPTATSGAYRIVMEALKNIVAHASASTCTIDLQQTRDGVEIRIVDDGVGFSGTPTGGLGLLSMRERALSLGGRLHVDSEPFHGTRVTLSLPTSTPLSTTAISS